MPEKLLKGIYTTTLITLSVLSVILAFTHAIYMNELQDFLVAGTILTLLGSGIAILIISSFSEIPMIITRPQKEPLPLVILLVQGLIIHFSSAQVAFPTVLVSLILVTSLTGLTLFSVGYFQWSNYIRFLPFPIIVGFLASAGILLVIVTITSMLPTSFSMNALWESSIFWVPAFIFGTGLFLLNSFYKSPLIFPGSIVIGFVLFYLMVVLTGTSLASLQSSHLLPGIKNLPLEKILDFNQSIEWKFILENLGLLCIIPIISTFALLYILINLDLTLKTDIDFNRELKITGLANIFAGSLGGLISYPAYADTSLAAKAGIRSRKHGIICGLICIAAIFIIEYILPYFPRFILSGLIIFFGIQLVYNWTIRIWYRFNFFDKTIILSVIIATIFLGFFAGIITGFIISMLFYIITYNLLSPIRQTMYGNKLPGISEHPPIPEAILKNNGDQIIYVKLQNYLFFGSAYSLIKEIKTLCETKQNHPVRFIIYDMEKLMGIDFSLELTFRKIAHYADKNHFQVILTGYESSRNQSLRDRISKMSLTHCVLSIPKVEEAIEYCESQLLKESNYDPEEHKDDHIYLDDFLGDKLLAKELPKYFETLTLLEGEFLVHQHDMSHELFYLESGKLNIFITLHDGNRKTITTINPGNFTGEIAFYLHSKRTASIIAETPCVLKKLTKENLEKMNEENPRLTQIFNHAMICLLTIKLADTTRRLEMLS